MSRQLYRSRGDRMLAGVAAGMAELWDADVSLVRILWVILVPFTGGFALLVYVIMAFVVPDEEDLPVAAGTAASASLPPANGTAARHEARAARRAARRESRGGRGSGGLLLGALLVIAGVYFLVREYLPDIDVNWLWPAALIVLGVIVLLTAFRRPPTDPAGPEAPR
jgi:phage shock protein C